MTNELTNSRADADLRRVMDILSRTPTALSIEMDMLHKPQIGATRHSHSVPFVESIPASDIGFPYGSTKWLWGVDLSEDTVLVGAGALRRAGSIYVSSASSEITFTTNDYWIGWEFDPSTNTLVVMPTEQSSRPIDGDGLMRGPLYQVKVTPAAGGNPTVVTSVIPWQHGIIVSNLFGV